MMRLQGFLTFTWTTNLSGLNLLACDSTMPSNMRVDLKPAGFPHIQ